MMGIHTCFVSQFLCSFCWGVFAFIEVAAINCNTHTMLHKHRTNNRKGPAICHHGSPCTVHVDVYQLLPACLASSTSVCR